MKKILLLLTFCLCIACDDIIEVEDISGSTVSILAPVDDSLLTDPAVNFSWTLVQDAERYTLQIATPNFETATQIVLDTTVTTNNFIKILDIGSYEWRVRAENSDYQTIYIMQNFSIE